MRQYWDYLVMAVCVPPLLLWVHYHPGAAFWCAGLIFALGSWRVWVLWRRPRTLLRIGGLEWTLDDFCRGWLITGRPGTGKTTAAINQMLWQVSKYCPSWGGVCVDDKGLYWETLSTMFRKLGRQDDLILLQVRPDGARSNWAPKYTYNFLADPYLPDSAKAMMVCDVATSLGQRSEQTFFRTQAQIQMELAFKALRCAELPVTLETTYDLLSSDSLLREIVEMLSKKGTPEAQETAEHFREKLLNQPPEQLGGVKTTIENYLKYFTDPDIAAVFCPKKPTFDLRSIDRGKVVCVSIPQRYPVERRYINTLLKLAFYTHAKRRFDKPNSRRAYDNLLIFWADEAQRIFTASDSGMSDHNVVDVIREAKATVVAATQSFTSLIPPLGEEKAKVLVLNLANRITFCAADEDSARIAADTIGKFKGKRRTTSYTAGRSTNSYTPEIKYFVEPHELRRLPRFHAVIQHCEGRFKKMKLAPLAPDGRKPSWY